MASRGTFRLVRIDRTRRVVAAFIAIGLVLGAGDGSAGEPRWAVPRFGEPPVAADAGLVTEGTSTAPPLAWHGSLSAGYAYGVGLAEDASRARGDIAFGLGLPAGFEAALGLPLACTFGTRDTSTPGAPLEGMGEDGFSAGDLRVGLLWSAMGADRGGVGLLVGLTGTVPTGENESLMGEGGFTAEPVISTALQVLGTRLSLNLGYRVRPEHDAPGGFEQDDDLFWRAAFRVPTRNDVAYSVEGEGAIGFVTDEGPWPTSDSRPVWLGGGVDLPLGRTHRFALLAGAGVAGRLSPWFSAQARVVFLPALPDEDRDGVERGDECPLMPEDLDGFEDSDGCPDPDNDGDGFPDDEDRCPQKDASSESTDGC